MLNSTTLLIRDYIKGSLFFHLNQFLDSWAEMHQTFALVFWKI